jgi:hypothetical protein
MQRAAVKKTAIQMTRSYLASLIDIKVQDLTPEVEAMKRDALTLRRLARQLRKGASDEGSKDSC